MAQNTILEEKDTGITNVAELQLWLNEVIAASDKSPDQIYITAPGSAAVTIYSELVDETLTDGAIVII